MRTMTTIASYAAAAVFAGSLMASSPAEASGLKIEGGGCINLGGIFNLCVDTNDRRGGYGTRHDGRKTYKREIDRVPYSYRCPRGTDSEAIMSNTFPGTRESTRICYDHYRR